MMSSFVGAMRLSNTTFPSSAPQYFGLSINFLLGLAQDLSQLRSGRSSRSGHRSAVKNRSKILNKTIIDFVSSRPLWGWGAHPTFYIGPLMDRQETSDAEFTSYYVPIRSRSGESVLTHTKCVLRKPGTGLSLVLPTRADKPESSVQKDCEAETSITYDVFRPVVNVSQSGKQVSFSGFRAWDAPKAKMKFFTMKSDASPIPISGYSYSLDSLDNSPKKRNLDDRDDSIEKVADGQTHPEKRSKKKASVRNEQDGFSFFSACISLIRAVIEDLNRNSRNTFVNVVNSRVAGRSIAVIALPANGRTGEHSLGVLVELSKRQLHGMGRASVVSFALPAVNNAPDFEQKSVRVQCSCWADPACSSCFHTDAILNHPVLVEKINEALRSAFPTAVDASSMGDSIRGMDALPAAFESDDKPYFWIAFNTDMRSTKRAQFVPVLVRSQTLQKRKKLTFEQRVQCQKCRRLQQKRGHCQHEQAVLDKAARIWDNSSDNTVDEEVVFADDNRIPAAFDDEPASIENDYPENKFVSTRRRPLLPCAADRNSIQELFRSISTSKETGQDVVLREITHTCKTCNKIMSNRAHAPDEADMYAPYAEAKRRVSLYTFVHGTLNVIVVDMKCLHCFSVNYYDGADSGLFAATERSVYSRDLLDFWLYNVACLDATFRDSYNLSIFATRLASMNQVRMGTPLSRSNGSEDEDQVFQTGLNRRAASSCFASFVKTLTSPSGNELNGLFQCSTCVDENGRMLGVALDGTATGILGDLPNFKRPSTGIPLTRNCARNQYVLRNSKARRFMDEFCKGALNGIRNGTFPVRVPKKGKNDAQSPAELIFHASERELPARLIRQFLLIAFRTFPRSSASSTAPASDENTVTPTATSPAALCSNGEDDDDDTDDEITLRVSCPQDDVIDLTDPPLDFEKYGHKLPIRALRICAADFLRCFCTASVPGGLLCSTLSVETSREMIMNLVMFSECRHGSKSPEARQCRPCEDCAAKLENCARKMISLCPSVGLLSESISIACECTESECPSDLIRDLSLVTALILDQAVETYQDFRLQFSLNDKGPCKEFNEQYGLRFKEGPHVGFSDDFEETGEFFPGRSIQRPRVHFLNANAHPEMSKDECSKNYRNSMSHSPGLFTVQCVCDNPKILGVMVMDACESLSTATNALLTRFSTLPHTVYYDNACNLSRSIALRFPWVLDKVRFCCDRFHYRSHKCCSVFDPDSYPCLDKHRTSGAEAINSRWASSRSHIRFLKGSNLMPFILAKSVYINLRALYRTKKRCSDVDDVDIVTFGNAYLPCTCNRCSKINVQKE